MDHFHIVKFERLLQQQRQGGPLDLRRQFIVRFAAKHPAKAGDLQRRFVTLLLLDLNASLHNRPQPRQHRLLLPGVTGHERFQLLRHQVHTFDVVPQTIFQQDKVNRRDAVTAAEEGAGLQQANSLFPAAIRDVGGIWQGVQLLAELEYQLKHRVRQFNIADLLLPLGKFLVAHLQRAGHWIAVFILLADQHRTEITFILHFIKP